MPQSDGRAYVRTLFLPIRWRQDPHRHGTETVARSREMTGWLRSHSSIAGGRWGKMRGGLAPGAVHVPGRLDLPCHAAVIPWKSGLTCVVLTRRNTRFMNELLQGLASYGLSGLLLAGAGWLVFRMIERGFKLESPPSKED